MGNSPRGVRCAEGVRHRVELRETEGQEGAAEEGQGQYRGAGHLGAVDGSLEEEGEEEIVEQV